MRNLLRRAIVQFALVIWTGLVLVPFALIALLSIRSNADIFANGLGIGSDVRLGNYAVAWNGVTGFGMSTYFLNSIVAALFALAIAIAAGASCAYFSTFMPRRMRDILIRTFIVASVMPLVLMIVPLYQFYNAWGILNQPWAVGVAYGAIALPTTFLILQAFYSDFPKEIVEAAFIDGSGQLRTFVQIVLPLSKGAITAVSMLILVFVWGETQLGVILLQRLASQTVPVGLLSFQGQWSTNLGALFAGLSIAAFPIMVIYLIFNKQVAKGVAMSGFGGH